MPKRVAISNINASTIDILNTIRANASAEYMDLVPEVTNERDIPRVGEALEGYPALANTFLNALVNRIAFVKVKSATFNNAYAELKKGYLNYGETVEEVFVSMTKARVFSADKAEARELKRTIPDVKSAFHALNYKVQYPITIQPEDLRQAFLDAQGVTDLIAKITGQVLQAAEYDEFLLFKYLLIKGVTHGKVAPVKVDFSDMKNAAKKFRGISNLLTFPKTEYNSKGVLTSTPKEAQYIFMDAEFNASYDVEVLAAAFNMDKATFAGHLKLIDDFTTFDNERFAEIRAESDMLEEVTAAELALMADVKAILVDAEWFQVYDNLSKMTTKEVASGMYWNYFYNVWKTVDTSPFSNAVAFVNSTATTAQPDSYDIEVTDKSVDEHNTVLTLTLDEEEAALIPTSHKFITTADSVSKGIAIHPFGAFIIPALSAGTNPVMKVGDTLYKAGILNSGTYSLYTLDGTETVGTTLKFYKASVFE